MVGIFVARQFLDHVLADEGLKCAAVLRGGRWIHKFFNTREELAQFIISEDSSGNTVYHACATYKTNNSRKRENAHALKSLYLDVEGDPDAVKKKTGYINATVGIYAVASFCRNAALPFPTLVASGGGLHVYWTLEAAITPEEWQPYANGLKRRAAELGLLADSARTADAASVLRTPGTHNRKREPIVQVQLVRHGEPSPLSAFAGLLDGPEQASSSSSTFALGDGSHLAYRNPNLSRLSLAGLSEHAPRYSNLIADRCKQIGELRATRGKLLEPVWRDCLGVVIYAEDGQHFAHEWSKGDERYTYQETENKLRDLKARDGATTCAQFQKSNPEGCKGCPSLGKIKSPIVLGCGENESEPQPGIRQETHHQDQISQQGQQKQKDNFSNGAFPLRWHGEENPNANRNWLVKQLLPETGSGLISGQWGTAKTFASSRD